MENRPRNQCGDKAFGIIIGSRYFVLGFFNQPWHHCRVILLHFSDTSWLNSCQTGTFFIFHPFPVLYSCSFWKICIWLFGTQRGFTALIWAVVGNHLPIVEYLHSRVEDIVAVEKVKYGGKKRKHISKSNILHIFQRHDACCVFGWQLLQCGLNLLHTWFWHENESMANGSRSSLVCISCSPYLFAMFIVICHSNPIFHFFWNQIFGGARALVIGRNQTHAEVSAHWHTVGGSPGWGLVHVCLFAFFQPYFSKMCPVSNLAWKWRY